MTENRTPGAIPLGRVEDPDTRGEKNGSKLGGQGSGRVTRHGSGTTGTIPKSILKKASPDPAKASPRALMPSPAVTRSKTTHPVFGTAASKDCRTLIIYVWELLSKASIQLSC